MRILYHHRTRGRDVEGVHIRGIVHALRELGQEVEVMSFPGADPEHSQGGQAAPARSLVATAASKAPGILFEFFEIAYNWVTLIRIGAAIRRFKPQLIYERYSLFLWATIWMARRHGIPVILEINDSALVERVRPLRMKALARRVERWCFSHCTGLVFISSHFRQLALDAYGNIRPSVISPNAADPVRFDPGRYDAHRLRAARSIDGTVVCGFVGSFAHWHGVDTFVNAIVERLGETPQLTLLMVGDGRMLPAVRERVAACGLSNRVLLPGRVGHEEIGAWIACMDYAVLPDSNQYGSPMKLFEFMAMGVGVVAPDYAPIAEVIHDGGTGWLFPRKDTDACVRRVLDLAAREDERARVGVAARNYILRERLWRNNAEQLLALVPQRGD